jgi:uncharacterized 2Fe-2S/4Fe-4S cluster protein (DUF4445 family)
MPEIKVHDKGSVTSLVAREGELLFHVLREHGFTIYSPCGGSGTCGKCRVYVKGQGDVTACLFSIIDSIEVVLPDQREARILTVQHSLTLELPFNPGNSSLLSGNPYGIAIDLGTTTLVSYLVNLNNGFLVETHSMLNPQTSFGGDVISRIHYASITPGGLRELQQTVIEAVNYQLNHFRHLMKCSGNDFVKITLAGNNTMLHLFLGADPSSMGVAPYIPGFTDTQTRKGKELGLECHPDAEITLLPSVSAFVGADIVAGIGSIRPTEEYRRYLFIDLGTNGELALLTPEKIWCCATAAGPVFEGANITCGMGGVVGAIAEFSEENYRVIGDEKPMGLCGSGLVDIVAFLLDSKLIDETGLLSKTFEIVSKEKSGTGNAIIINQEDIRQFQLAKSAIASGIIILLKLAGMKFEDLDALFLAGGFGNYLNVESAMKVGLIPSRMREKVIFLGNTAGTGSLLALRSVSFIKVLNTLLRKTIHIELSEDNDFPLEFAMNMAF